MKKRSQVRRIIWLLPLCVVVAALITVVFLIFPKPSRSYVGFTSSTATLTNSRFSYIAGVSSGTSGNSNITIDSSGNPDNDVNHLFPGDEVCFAPSTFSGCRDNMYYTVVSTEGADGHIFTVDTPLTSTLNAADYVIASQSGKLTISVTLATTIPDSGDLIITVPTANSPGNTVKDGFPDWGATVAASGFDADGTSDGLDDGLVAADITISRTSGGTCADGNWDAPTISTASDLTISFNRNGSTCASTAVLSIEIGDSDATHFLINPGPITTHTQGVADAYTLNISSKAVDGTLLDYSNVMVAPVEAVLVSATVQETLSFTVAGKTAGSYCGQTTDINTTATSVPWGTISAASTFYEGAQQLTVSTNAGGGYVVTIEENDQMNKESDPCDSPANDTADYTDNCIRDTVCSASGCDETDGYYWTDSSTYDGLGYSLQDFDGTDAAFVYDSTSEPCTSTGGGTSTNFCSKQIADIQASETRATIMSHNGPVNSKDIYVCFRIDISGLQPAGYYYNTVKYTATPTF
jgi:hypothetical protein